MGEFTDQFMCELSSYSCGKCNGTGRMWVGFFNHSATEIKCDGCNGSGKYLANSRVTENASDGIEDMPEDFAKTLKENFWDLL